MKKLIIFIMIVLLFSGCSNEYETWREINVPDVGSFKTPKEWVYNDEDETIYIADKDIEKSGDYNTYLIGILSDNGKKGSSWHLLGKQIECGNLISSEVFSDSCTIGKKEFWIDGKKCERFFIDMYSSDRQLYFIVWDDNIEYELVKKIAKSFKMCS